MTMIVEMTIEVSENKITSQKIHEMVLEALNDVGVQVFFMSTENITNMENETNDVIEHWNVESDIIPFTREDTSDEE